MFSRYQIPIRFMIALCSSFFIFVVLNQLPVLLKAPLIDQKIQAIQQLECSFDTTPKVWQICTVPHNWDYYKPGYTGDALYRFNIDHPSDKSKPIAISLIASMSASIKVNNTYLNGSDDKAKEPIARHWNQYMLFPIPTTMLNDEHNQVLIRVHGYANSSSGLLKLYIGPTPLLKERHHTVTFLSNIMTYGALTITLMVGLLAGIAAVVGRNWTIGYFAFGCLISVFYLLDTLLVHIPFSREVWERSVHISIVCSEMFFVIFAFRILNFIKKPMTNCMVGYGIIGTLVIIFVPESLMLPAASIWEGASLVMILMASMMFFYHWLKEGVQTALFIALALFSVLISFIHDWIPWVLGMGVEPPYTFYLGPTFFVLMVAILSLVQMRLELNFRLFFRSANRMPKNIRRERGGGHRTHAVH